MDKNIEIFEGKTFQDLTKDIYENSQKNGDGDNLIGSLIN